MGRSEIVIVDEQSLKTKIHIMRGQQIMLDYDLAEIYGYQTNKLNEQVRNNSERFEGEDFMFQLTKDEFDNLISKNRISSWGGRRKLPFAFTEQGIYMLMTVLKGPLAIHQSRALVRLFKNMKDYIIENQQLMIPQKDYFALSEKVNNNASDIQTIKETMLTRAELSGFMKLFDNEIEHEEILILDGEPFKANIAYQRIYQKAKKKILIIDDYIGVKTLNHLAHSKQNTVITIISDNKSRPPLRQTEYNDFLTENPGRIISFIQSSGRAHDRYIILDESTKDMKVYHCGASSKDAGKRITTITRISEIDNYKNTIQSLINNPPLLLK